MRVAQWGLARKRTGQLARRAAPQQGDCRSAGLMSQSPFRDPRNSDALLNAERQQHDRQRHDRRHRAVRLQGSRVVMLVWQEHPSTASVKRPLTRNVTGRVWCTRNQAVGRLTLLRHRLAFPYRSVADHQTRPDLPTCGRSAGPTSQEGVSDADPWNQRCARPIRCVIGSPPTNDCRATPGSDCLRAYRYARQVVLAGYRRVQRGALSQ